MSTRNNDQADSSLDFPEIAGPWNEVASIDYGPLRVALARAHAEDGGACIEPVISENDVALPMRGIPNCEPAAWTLDRTATVEQLGGPAAVTGLSITVGYASAQVETIRILGAPDAIVEITGDAWIATWLETLGPVAVEIETGNQVFTCDFASDRGATIAELSTCDFVLPR